jgi:hypothetical protein
MCLLPLLSLIALMMEAVRKSFNVYETIQQSIPEFWPRIRFTDEIYQRGNDLLGSVVTKNLHELRN